MLTFKKAIKSAETTLHELQKGAEDIQLEEAILDENNGYYAITFSYFLKRGSSKHQAGEGLKELAFLMSNRKVYKTFLIDEEDGSFKGLRNYEMA
ncbi:hypothetical protein [Marinospirillum insulare]|uniref:Uncharacterized protein n=1 Tax=Marinospirillum insulare TaxID=217169 RepID=A0ABQ6A2X3_9GAMM|nr:hypothetical protein [Marinospirillum insulare]GLR64430.1 hypothetical protein GCM10007878_18680 [Marinospirillum insulare]